jgi:phospholipase D1/2
MGTHDEITRSYFAGSDVHCALVQRSGGKGNRLTDGTIASAFFSHHQKTIVCDAPPIEGSHMPLRRLVAFIGGLDLTTGAISGQLSLRYHALEGCPFQIH